MRKYLISVALELDGHSSSESYYLESQRVLNANEVIDIIYAQEIEENELTIDMDRGSQAYGTIYGYAFALSITELVNVQPNTMYYTSSRTG